MAKYNGTLIAIISGSDRVLHQTNATLTVDVDLQDSTTKESEGWAEHEEGVRNWNISFDGKYDEAGEGLSPDEILAAIIARSADTDIKFTTDGATGAAGWTGKGTFQNISISGPQEVPTTFSGNIKGNGPLAAI